MKEHANDPGKDTHFAGDNTPFVIGIGASAGGISACREFLRQLNHDSDGLSHNPISSQACFIVCQHISPHHDSKLTEILAKDTSLGVKTIEHNQPIQSGHLFIAPPNADIELKDNKFFITEPHEGPYAKPNINKFFLSLAENSGEKAVAVVLSGTGSDGSEGIASIRNAGGAVLVQDPESSDYDGMPRAAIATHMVDVIASPAVIAQQLFQLLNSDTQAWQTSDSKDDYDAILKLVSQSTNIDFREYKTNTIQRRLKRRLSLKGLSTLAEYLEYIKNDAEEILAFTQDAFIVVSEFYRDPAEFALFQQYILNLITRLENPKLLRIWVPGCATGEEAYTIAMMLEDIRNEQATSFDYKIFATDISQRAIDHARLAYYTPDKLNAIPEGWLEKYFTEERSDLYQVRRFVRDRVVLSVHNILSDPPFSRLNIISCRNLLIYFDSGLQDKITRLFNYSLVSEQSLLFIGKSESITNQEFFKQSDQSSRIFTKKNIANSSALIAGFSLGKPDLTPVPAAASRKSDDIERSILLSLNQTFTPASVVLDSNNRMVYAHGDYLNLMSGKSGMINTNFFDMVHPDYRSTCRSLIYRVQLTGEPASSSRFQANHNGNPVTLQLFVQPLVIDNEPLYCIGYTLPSSAAPTETATSYPPNGDMGNAMREIENELDTTRENLQTVIEELEASNEQLQYYNEELQSTNEEYQSTNEELQTVNEELQSTNEELITINEEYSVKALEQSKLSSDLANIQESLDIPFLLINKDYRIERFTRSCDELFDTKKIKLDDLIYAIGWYEEFPYLKSLISKAEQERKTQRYDLKFGQSAYQCQVSPYINSSDQFDGFTVIFYNTTAFEHSQSELRLEKFKAQQTLELVLEGVIRLDESGNIEFINHAALTLMHRDYQDTIGQPIDKRLHLQSDDGEPVNINSIIQQCAVDGIPYNDKAAPLILKNQLGDSIFIELSVVPISLSEHQSGSIISLRDISDKYAQIQHLKWQSIHDSLTGLVNRSEMQTRIERCILASKRDGSESSLMYLDLDQFKVINDTCGHAAGDQLLTQLSHVMEEMLRSRDTLARLGGDEFAVLLDRCPIIDAEKIARKIQQKISDYRFTWKDKVFRVGVSIGIVRIDKDICTVAEVLSDADAACYAAKDQGRNTIQIHSQDNEVIEQQRSQMRSIADINAAIENHNFRLYFHQIRDVKTAQIRSWEVLLRMQGKDNNLLVPDLFLPAAERFGLINRIDGWVFENTIKQLSLLFSDKAFSEYPKISINLSAHTITDLEYLELFETITTQHQFPNSHIWFEITETAAVSNMVKARTFMKKAKSLGFNFSLDDFGTGMSSLSYLRELPIDAVKIDMSFLKNITRDSVNREIVRSVKEVSHLLNLTVIAEGVESQEQLNCLKDLGIDAFQGYLMGKPMPYEEFAS